MNRLFVLGIDNILFSLWFIDICNWPHVFAFDRSNPKKPRGSFFLNRPRIFSFRRFLSERGCFGGALSQGVSCSRRGPQKSPASAKKSKSFFFSSSRSSRWLSSQSLQSWQRPGPVVHRYCGKNLHRYSGGIKPSSLR